MTAMQIDRAVVEQALDSINELFAAEQSEGGERGGHIRTPATREHLVRVAQARKALHESCGALRAALAHQAEPVEPVAWNWMLDGQPYGQAYYGRPPDADIVETSRLRENRTVRLLYTAPPQRKPLPNHDQHCVDVPGYGLMAVRLVRVVERAHGIKE